MTSQMRVRTADEQGVRTLTLHRPEARNALDRGLIETLTQAIEDAGADPQVRVLVLRGEGLGFCAGADLKETAAIEEADAAQEHARRLRRLLETPERIKKPVIAEVHGFALGAGCALALACDLTVAAGDACIGLPEMRHHVVPALVVPGFVRRVGPWMAFDWLANGRVMTAMASGIPGLICLPEGADLRAEVAARAAELARQPADLIAAVKGLVRMSATADPETAMAGAEQVNVENRLRRARAARQG